MIDTRFSEVGDRFRTCFHILFFTCLLQITMIILITQDVVPRLLSAIMILTSYTYALVWIYLIIVRFSHSGKVCSGDYLSENDSKEGYLTE